MANAKKLHSLKNVRVEDSMEENDIDSVAYAKARRPARAYDILLEAKTYWDNMDFYRKERERCKNYNFGKQWDDMIEVDGVRMSEEKYIHSMGNVALKNNLIRRLVRNVIGVYRSQDKDPTCIARDWDEKKEA